MDIKGLWLEKNWFAQHTCSFNSCLDVTWLFEANCKYIIFSTSPWQCERSIPSFLCARLAPYTSCIDLDYFTWDTDLNLILTSLPVCVTNADLPGCAVPCQQSTERWVRDCLGMLGWASSCEVFSDFSDVILFCQWWTWSVEFQDVQRFK